MNLEQQIEHYRTVRMRITNAKFKAVPKSEDVFVKNDRPMSDPRKEIMKLCADEFGVSVEDILSSTKKTAVQKARWKAAWLIYQRNTMSIAGIGRFMNKDHTTILHILKKYEKNPTQGGVKSVQVSSAPVCLTQGRI